MPNPHQTRDLAKFIHDFSYDMLSEDHIERLKQSLLEALGTAIAAFDEPVLRALRVHIKDFNSSGPCSLIGGVKCAPDMAAYHNCGLIGFLDMNDMYLGVNGTVYPSDSVAAVLATLEYQGGSGKDILRGMAISYVTQIVLNKSMSRRSLQEYCFSQAALGAAAATSAMLNMDVERMVNGLNIAASAGSYPHPVGTGNLSDWVHMVRPSAVRHGVESAFLGLRGIGGVSHELEGEDRVPDLLEEYEGLTICPNDVDCILEISSRKYMANVYAQSAIEAAIHIRHLYDINPEEIASVELETFNAAYKHLGGGNGMDCVDIVSREEAVNSLPFLVSTALIKGNIDQSHLTHRSIRSQEMQRLRGLVTVKHNPKFDEFYPKEMCQSLTVTMKDGTEHHIDKCNYLGHHTKPTGWDGLIRKFHCCAEDFANEQLRTEIVDVVRNLENHRMDKLTSLLARVAPV